MAESSDAENCVFCKIAAGEIPADIVVDGERVVAFRDSAPKADVHVLVVPRAHHRDVVALAGDDPDVLTELVLVGAEIAADVSGGEFRLVFNTGRSVGQSVFHAHGHILAGPGLGE